MAATTDGNAATHQTMAAAALHCADRAASGETDGDASFECRMVCPGMLAQPPVVGETRIVAPLPRNLHVAVSAAGLNSAADPPPPRLG